MKIISFNFDKIAIERFGQFNSKAKVNTNIKISDINKVNLDLIKSDEQTLMMGFEYDIDYAPEIAKLSFKGNIIISLESEEADSIIEQWKEKKFDSKYKVAVLNVIMQKSNIQAFELEDKLNLPTHIPLPKLSTEAKKE